VGNDWLYCVANQFVLTLCDYRNESSNAIRQRKVYNTQGTCRSILLSRSYATCLGRCRFSDWFDTPERSIECALWRRIPKMGNASHLSCCFQKGTATSRNAFWNIRNPTRETWCTGARVYARCIRQNHTLLGERSYNRLTVTSVSRPNIAASYATSYGCRRIRVASSYWLVLFC